MRPNQTRSRILTAAEVAEYLHLPRRTVYEYARTGRLPAFRVGRRLLRFDRRALDRWLTASQGRARPRECRRLRLDRHDIDPYIKPCKATARRKGNGSKSRDPI